MFIKDVEIYQLIDTNHNEDFWVFYYYKGDSVLSKFSVGKYNAETNPNGAQTEEDAIEFMQMNIPELSA